ncbi:MAG: 1-deoxy-D-xylulose-5-phosphate reductoisomerase [Lachnospiraceae bacterium]|nr:1-deoxy-D-xylulose-5-phosphate reductoisomerase [Lachnospiraceae bacterium]MBQ4276338.1 1-deoxy-D-xylulose-5-phosphate reductoisomerase [Lachnospiraceae bacterium]
MKNLVILGSTGSIGTQTLEIVAEKKEDFKVLALAAYSNVSLIESQIRMYSPKYAVLFKEDAASVLATKVKDLPVKVLSGMDGLIEISTLDECDMLVASMVGMIGIRPTIAAVNAGIDIALANKETLVTAGHIIVPLAKEKHVNIYPVDSEHSAIYQCLKAQDRSMVDKILLTASGGPFLGRKYDELKDVTLNDALNHPNWSMGKKITIDSASLVNKGLEVIEAKWLFDVDIKDVEVIVHPQSIIHSMVQFKDNAVLAQLGLPDMKLPIQYALYEGNRRTMPEKKIDFFALSELDFKRVDHETFKGIKLAVSSYNRGYIYTTVYNAANEIANRYFQEGKIKFLQIYDIIEDALTLNFDDKLTPTLDEILEAESRVYDYISTKY